MYLANIRGLWKLAQHKPQLVSTSAVNIRHRLAHNFRSIPSKNCSHPPEVITVFITDRCNMRCRECHYAHSETPGYQLNRVGDMEFDLYRKVVDEIPGNPIISITGGEPLLHSEVAEFIAFAKTKGQLCSLVTNGWMLAKRAQDLCEAGLDILTVSLDGPQDMHDSIRGDGSYERIIGGIETILRQPVRPLVFISMAISDMNFDQLESTYNLVKRWGVDGMNINHLWMQTDEMVQNFNGKFDLFPADEVAWDVNPNAVDVGVVAGGLEAIRRRNWGSGFVFSEAPFLDRDEIADWYQVPEQIVKYETVRCGWIRFKFWPDGKVKPCRDWEVGDINQQHAMEIWNGKEYRVFRQALAENGLLPICTRCCQIAYR